MNIIKKLSVRKKTIKVKSLSSLKRSRVFLGILHLVERMASLLERFLERFSGLPPFSKRERVLGVSKTTRRYDLPLSGGTANGFLRVLIGLMTVLGLFSLCTIFLLSGMTDRWTDGLSGKISVEIPASDSAGEIIPAGIVREMTQATADLLRANTEIQSVEVKTEEDIQSLLSPWLGEELVMESVPIPGLISVTLKDSVKETDLGSLLSTIREVAPRARIDSHKEWLSDVLRFAEILRNAAILLGAIIGITTLVAVSGAVRSNLAENKEELELLHIMGASDSYIASQVQRHMGILSFQGGGAGLFFGFVLLVGVGFFAKESTTLLFPDFQVTGGQTAAFFLLPFLIALLAVLTARFTVLHVLRRMP